ncbi:hypothetical protein FH972_015200 [Carpinus fangiana]|uniref:Uncharacterized protein n=1 Tax=Carpinus fangiana TaxID=176857 RepID=A0A5N6RF94_9ROSI|nr:hypothetical protein FH972_015200 [Carpinus fangiana]
MAYNQFRNEKTSSSDNSCTRPQKTQFVFLAAARERQAGMCQNLDTIARDQQTPNAYATPCHTVPPLYYLS